LAIDPSRFTDTEQHVAATLAAGILSRYSTNLYAPGSGQGPPLDIPTFAAKLYYKCLLAIASERGRQELIE